MKIGIIIVALLLCLCSCAHESLPKAEAARLSKSSVVCTAKQIAAAQDVKAHGGSCAEAVNAVAFVIQTDPACVDADINDATFTCKAARTP